MNLTNIINIDTIINSFEAKSKDQAIDYLLHHLKEKKFLSGTVKLFSLLHEKEKEDSSAIGRGVAMPHGTSKEISNPIGVFAISKNGINFNSADGQLCHYIFLTLSPYKSPNEHRKIIGKFRKMIHLSSIRSELLNNNNNNDIFNIISNWEQEFDRVENI